MITTETGFRTPDALTAELAPPNPLVEEPAKPAQPVQSTEPAPQPAPEPEPAFRTHIVQQGDTVAAIARRYGLDMDSILWNNPDVKNDPDMLVLGQELIIPARDGILYTMKLGDTLLDVADLYQVEPQNVIGVSANAISDPNSIREGAVLLLPGAQPPPPPSPATTPQPVFAASAPDDVPSGDADFAAPPPGVTLVSGFIWPATGPITEYFGAPRGGGTYHSGLDIGLYNGYGSDIVAAAPGQVVLAAYDSYGLGYHVVVRHDNGYETGYAHLSDIYVEQGQWVSQGEAVGAAGCTGYCTGTHLHFEVKQGGAYLDPLDYLP